MDEVLEKGSATQVHLRLKTGLYEPLGNYFVKIMANFNIVLRDEKNPLNHYGIDWGLG